MSANALEIIEQIQRWDSVLQVSRPDFTEDLNVLRGLNQAALTYLSTLEASASDDQQLRSHLVHRFESCNHPNPAPGKIKEHFELLLCLLSNLEETDNPEFAFQARWAFLLGLAKWLLILLMIGMGTYFFLLAPIVFARTFTLCMSITIILSRDNPFFIPFSMLAIFCSSLDAFSAARGISGFSTLPALLWTIITAPIFSWVTLPFIALAVGYLTDKIRHELISKPKHEALKSKLQAHRNPLQNFERLGMANGTFFQGRRDTLCKKIDANYDYQFNVSAYQNG